MTKKTVLVTDFTWPSPDIEAEILAAVDAELVIAKSGEEAELIEMVSEADAMLTCFADVTGDVIRAGGALQVIGRYGIGVDNIDVAAATALDIPVTYVPAYCVDEVAEHTLGFMFALARKITLYDRAVRHSSWTLSDGLPIFRMRGRTLGLIGFGRIGRSVAEKAVGLSMDVIYYDPDPELEEAGNPAIARRVSLDEVIRESDFVSLHAPLNSENEMLVDKNFLEAMKPSACLINCARGGLIDHGALHTALREGTIAGAALDVFVPERLPAEHSLLKLDNLIATPHVAFYSAESVQELQRRASMNVAAILGGRHPEALVNPEVLERRRWQHLVPGG
ncbi:MAG: C-terminal binding protein [Pseudomonadota bacterium]|jgi:D-3-phosphoglycerate dehydrogenase|nr:C-terminal binding protein [Pseudomonadota bacterium]